VVCNIFTCHFNYIHKSIQTARNTTKNPETSYNEWLSSSWKSTAIGHFGGKLFRQSHALVLTVSSKRQTKTQKEMTKPMNCPPQNKPVPIFCSDLSESLLTAVALLLLYCMQKYHHGMEWQRPTNAKTTGMEQRNQQKVLTFLHYNT